MFAPRREAACVRLGEPVWGHTALLRDLELRLGLPPVVESVSARIPSWSSRIKSLGDESAFYARSFGVDELGTTETLLAWRDDLIAAGWDGAPIPGGGERLDALARLESHPPLQVVLGDAERLVRAERALERARALPYVSLSLMESPELWPGRWRRIFALLEARGVAFTRFAPEHPGAPPESDLGRLQAHVRGGAAGPIRGDGSLLVMRGDTPGDLAELLAAWLAAERDAEGSSCVVRCCDAESLDAALERHGLPPQGCAGESAWRPAMQVLPLAVELAFAPRDPFRMLELLTLPLGPFRGTLGARLARAVSRQPGTGGKEWERQKQNAFLRMHAKRVAREQAEGRSEAEAEAAARAHVDASAERLATWLEGSTLNPSAASRASIVAVTERVRAWLQGRLRGGDATIYGAAYAQAVAFLDALAHDTREVLSLEEVRQLLDRYARSEQRHERTTEAAGRVAHVSHPSGLLAPSDRVHLWGFVAGVERRPIRSPWNAAERAALRAAGVSFVDPSAYLRAEADAWRRAILAARERVLLFIPRTIQGVARAPHPTWDEIRARLALDERSEARITREARHLLLASGSERVPVEECRPLHLPEARSAWRIPGELVDAATSETTTSVTSLETLATCPLRWVFEHRAGLRSGAISVVATGALLSGSLGHRLVEELHLEGAFELPEEPFLERAAERLEGLLRAEGATMLLPGASIERLQLTRSIHSAVRALHRYLARADFRIAAVEETITTSSAAGPLHGRLDLRLVDREGRPAILDLKWGSSSYRDALASGRAVQLAVYARAVAEANEASEPPPAAYFALRSGEVLSTDPRMKPDRVIHGPPLEETLRRVETTGRAVHESCAAGVVHVTGTSRALPLLDALGVPEADRARHFESPRGAACGYCDYKTICGRAWEAFA